MSVSASGRPGLARRPLGLDLLCSNAQAPALTQVIRLQTRDNGDRGPTARRKEDILSQ